MSAAGRGDVALFEDAFAFAGVGMALLDLDGRGLKVNDALCDIVGYERAELLARELDDLAHPDDRRGDRHLVRQLVAGARANYHLEKRYIHKSGRVVWSLFSLSVVRDGAGRPLHLLAQLHDLGAQRAAEQQPDPARGGVDEPRAGEGAGSAALVGNAPALREQHRAQELLFELSEHIKGLEDSAALIGAACRCLCAQFEAHDCSYGELNAERTEVSIRISASGTGLWTAPIASWAPQNVLDMQRGRSVIVEDTWTDARTAARYGRAYRSHTLMAYAAAPLMRDGLWVATLLLSFDHPRKFSADDVSLFGAAAVRMWAQLEHSRMLTALRASEAQYRRIVETMHEGIWECDEHSVIRYVNRRMATMLGYEPSEMIGKPNAMFVDRSVLDQLSEAFERRRRGVTESFDLCFPRRDGAPLWTRVTTSPLMDASGRFVGAVALVADIDDRRKAEEALRMVNAQLEQRVVQRTQQLQRSLSEKEVLLREIHHRVKNNLQVICSLLNLQAQSVGHSELTEILETSQGRVRSIALVHERLYQSKDLAEVDFHSYITTLTSDLGNTFAAALRNVSVHVTPTDVHLPIDVAVLCGLLVNELVSNALKHAFPSGRMGAVSIALRAEEQQLCLSVSDDGVGMPDGPRRAGSLGLELVQMLAAQLAATLRIDGGEGTRVSISFPRPREPSAAGEPVRC
ncbi:MAG: PAS domain S-box protein [Polyangiales bacterium]